MVRGPAALLAAAAYFLLVGELPSVGGEAGLYLAGCLGAAAVAVCAIALLGWGEDTLGLTVLGAGALLLAAALARGDVGAAANPVEALAAGAAGLLFARAFGMPAAVVALPLLVAGIDAAAVLGGDSDPLVRAGGTADVLSFDLPLWGGEGSVARLGLLDAMFVALFAQWSLRFALRPRSAIPLMVLAVALAVAVGVALDRPMPVLPFVAVAFLAPAADRLPRLLRSD